MTPWQEQAAQERADRERRQERIRKAALENPDMPLVLLAERFNATLHEIGAVLQKAGIQREKDLFSWNGRTRRSA